VNSSVFYELVLKLNKEDFKQTILLGFGRVGLKVKCLHVYISIERLQQAGEDSGSLTP